MLYKQRVAGAAVQPPTSQHSLASQQDNGAGEQLSSRLFPQLRVSAISLIGRRHIVGCALAAEERDDSSLPVCKMR